MEKVTLPNGPVDLWGLTEPMPLFTDRFEIMQLDLRGRYEALGDDFDGNLVGYVEAKEKDGWDFFETEGVHSYTLNLHTPDGQKIGGIYVGNIFVQWAGLRRIPFVGYANKNRRWDDSNQIGVVWLIIPKSREQLLSAAATFYKRRKLKDKAPDIIGLSDYLNRSTSVGDIADPASFVPMRLRAADGKAIRTAVTEKRLKEFRETAPELTDDILAEAVRDIYKDFFVDNAEAAREAVKECIRARQPLTKENVLQQLAYLIEDRKLLKLYTANQYLYSEEYKMLREKVDRTVEEIYETACKRVFDLSELNIDEDVMDYFRKSCRDGEALAHSLNSYCCGQHCKKYGLVSCMIDDNFPPFRCYDYRFGKDVTFAPTFDDAKAYHDRQRGQTRKEPDVKQEQPAGKSGKGCLLWFAIFIPASVTAILMAIL